MSLRLWLTVIVAVLSILLAWQVLSQQPGEPPQPGPAPNLRDFMQAKLKHSQKILEGLTLENLDQVAKESQDLSLLSLQASWNVLQTEDYAQFSKEFRRAANEIRDAAKKKNLDGAALAYVDVTMKCINCHKYVRGVRMAKLDR